jgi:hypothetical protein
MPAKYSIHVEKDGANVKATYNLAVETGSPELLASFDLNVAGKNLIDTFLPQKAFNGTKFTILADPSKDAIVSFDITTNQSWTADGSDTLRGDKRVDDVDFSN